MAKRPFDTQEPIAYFITWTTYGAWMPSDDRGWWLVAGGWWLVAGGVEVKCIRPAI